MKNPKSETGLDLRDSVLECGGSPPLSSVAEHPNAPKSARGLAQSKTWRPGGARDSSRFNPLFTRAVGVSPATPRWATRSGLKSALLIALAFILLPAACRLRAWGQSYSIDWWTVDGGGGTSTGGVFAVSGTIGQPDAGPTMTGGSFALTGGFWGVIAAVQTPGAPYLTVFRSATNTVVVSWPLAGAEGWVLQATNALPNMAAPWPVIPPPYQTNAPNLQFIEPAPVGNKFYRLYKP